MNLGFFGIQYSFGLQQSAVNPIYDFLGASPDEIPLLNLAGPLTGLIIQPIIGALSDKTWHPKRGRRKPYFFAGALLCSIALFFFPFSSSLWMAVGLLWILDIGNNTAMEPYRAFIADKLDSKQQPTGFLAQSFFTGLGQTLANLSLFIFPIIILGTTGALPTWVFASFILGSICSIATIWWSMKTTPEIPPTKEEIEVINKYNAGKPHPVIQLLSVLIALASGPVVIWLLLSGTIPTSSLSLLILPICFLWVWFLYFFIKTFPQSSIVKIIAGILSPFLEIVEAIRTMPKVMWSLALVYLFQWYALFCYWQNSSKCVAQNAFEWKSLNEEQAAVNEKWISFKSNLSSVAKQQNISTDSIFIKDASYSFIYNSWKDKTGSTTVLTDEELKTADYIQQNSSHYEKAVSWTGLVNAWYNIVTFLVAFGLVWMARRFGPKWVHAVCLVLIGAGLIAFSFTTNKYLFFPAITGFGIAWASMMGIPYLMVVSKIPKEKYGVYMGIINMMIVIPMFIQTTTFGYIMKHVLNNDSSKAITFAGVFLLIAAVLTLLIKSGKSVDNTDMLVPAGH